MGALGSADVGVMDSFVAVLLPTQPFACYQELSSWLFVCASVSQELGAPQGQGLGPVHRQGPRTQHLA